MVNKDWNIFNIFEWSPENSTENSKKIIFSNFHLKNSRTWIFTLWNHILQTQTLLLQPILVYIYIYNIFFPAAPKNLAPYILLSTIYFLLKGDGKREQGLLREWGKWGGKRNRYELDWNWKESPKLCCCGQNACTIWKHI